MANPVYIATHVSRGLKRLLSQFADAKNIRGVLSAYLAQIQELETAVFDLMVKRYLATAEGAQLDGIGRLLGLPRAGRNDTQYRIWLGARLLILRSNGRIEELLAILVALLPPSTSVHILEQPPAAMQIDIVDPIDEDLGNQLHHVMQDAKGGGIRLLLSWRRAGDHFQYSSVFGTSQIDASLGYGGGEYSAIGDGSTNTVFAP